MPDSHSYMTKIKNLAGPSLTDEDIEVIWLVFRIFDDLMTSTEFGYRRFIAISEETLDRAKEDAVRHHLSHLCEMNIQQSTVDPYKIAAWYGFFVTEHADDRRRVALLATIYLMRHFLEKEFGVTLDRETSSLLYYYAANNGIKDEHGIGMNGLFMAFNVARQAVRNKLHVKK